MKTKLIIFNGKTLKVLQETCISMFQTNVNEKSFRNHVANNPNYSPEAIHHPYCQDEYFKNN